MLVHVQQLVHAVAQPQELSILNDPKEQKNSKTSGQNPNAGWYNRFVQSGKSDHETKTNGCFGGRVHASVCTTASHRRRLQSFAACCRPYDCVCCMHMCTVAFLYVCVHIYMPQDSMCRLSAARPQATYTRPRASSGCRGSGVTRVAWQRPGRMHRSVLLPCVHDVHSSMHTHHDQCTHTAFWPLHHPGVA